MTTSTPLLLSGAGLPMWIWDEVREQLGTGVVAPRPVGAGASLRDHAEAALAAAPAGGLTLVAHSAGGLVAAAVLAAAPERVDGLLAVAAVVPAAGRSFIGSMPFPQRLVLPVLLRVAGTRPPASAVRKGLGAGLDEATAERLVADLVPESQAYFRDRAPAFAAPVRRGYVHTTSDGELPAALQRHFAARLDTTFERTVPGGHLPMLEQPGALADAVRAFMSDGAPRG